MCERRGVKGVCRVDDGKSSVVSVSAVIAFTVWRLYCLFSCTRALWAAYIPCRGSPRSHCIMELASPVNPIQLTHASHLDERHPTCERCEKGSHKCLGYEQPFIFVHQVPRYPGTTSVPAPAPCSSSKPKAKPTENPTTKHENDHRQRVLAKAKANSPPSTLATVSSVGFPRTRLDLRGFQDEIVIAHLLSKFTIGFGHDMPRGTDAPTMGAVLTSRNSKSSAYLSGLGLAQAFFGRLYKDDGMIRQSALLYGKALTSLRGDLQLANLEEVRSRAYLHLWTSVFLGLYEIVSSAGSSNWLQHSMGVSALVSCNVSVCFGIEMVK